MERISGSQRHIRKTFGSLVIEEAKWVTSHGITPKGLRNTIDPRL